MNNNHRHPNRHTDKWQEIRRQQSALNIARLLEEKRQRKEQWWEDWAETQQDNSQET